MRASIVTWDVTQDDDCYTSFESSESVPPVYLKYLPIDLVRELLRTRQDCRIAIRKVGKGRHVILVKRCKGHGSIVLANVGNMSAPKLFNTRREAVLVTLALTNDPVIYFE